MKNIAQHILLSLALLLLATTAARAQVSPNCATASDDDFITGQVFFNQGSVSNAINAQRSTKFTVGQPAMGQHFGIEYRGAFGLWSRFLKKPNPLTVVASEGDLEDRVQVNWFADPLSPAANVGHKIYRDGALLATVDGQTFSYVDFNVIAGKFYVYEVSGVNAFGEGEKGSTIGFLNPNGVVTGQVKTVSGNPVPGAIVTLTPTLGAALAFDGVDDMAFAEHTPAYPTDEFTIAAWVKIGDGNDGSAIIDGGSTIGKNWWLHTTPAASGKGVRFAIGNGPGNVTALSHVFPDTATASDWRHVAATYNGSSMLLYVDGELTGTTVGSIQSDSISLFFGRKADGTKFFNGKLDEVRFFDRQLSQTELQMFLTRTVSATTPGLVGYWKFDEAAGSKAFDQSPTGQKIYFCGATWTSDKPTVVNAGVTDVAGFYEIAGINYGGGTTFTAVASKNSYFNQSLEFNAANLTYANLTDFDLPDSSTVTLTVKGFDFSANDQTLLSKATAAGANLLRIGVKNGNVEMTVGAGSPFNFGALGMGFHHLAFTLRQSGSSLIVNYFKDGAAAGSNTFSGSTANLAGLPWKLGASATGATGHDKFFTGLIDEAAFFNTLLLLPDIQTFANVGTSPAHPNLFHYFNLNEGAGTALHDMGTALGADGTTFGATFSSVAGITDVLPHEFTPSSRLATLNPSTTSVDQVDFTDQSTIPVSGFVRFEGTACFQDSVEILVNGASHVPPIFTDADGEFVADFEPGADVRLSPKSADHNFNPAFWDLENLSTPVSGILFRNQTNRKIKGQIVGGACGKDIFPTGATAVVEVRALNNCLVRTQTVSAATDGEFEFTGLPPGKFTVSVVSHSISFIGTFLNNLGGTQVSLRAEDATVDFIYKSSAQVEMSPFPTNGCGGAMLVSGELYTMQIKVFEDYFGERCYLDTALLEITNEISNHAPLDTFMTGGVLSYNFRAGAPNVTFPFLKLMQVKSFIGSGFQVGTQTAVVTGDKPRVNEFVTVQPNLPMLILRDPPGDGSYAYREAGTTSCTSVSLDITSESGSQTTFHASLFPTSTMSAGLVVEAEYEVEPRVHLNGSIASSVTATNGVSAELCFTNLERISTGGDDVIVGEQGGDVFMGGAINLIFGKSDKIAFDELTCSYSKTPSIVAGISEFATTYVYSEYLISSYLIPELEEQNTPETIAQANEWRAILAHNDTLKSRAVFDKNISFDAGAIYEFSKTIEQNITRSTLSVNSEDFSGGFELGLFVNDQGGSIAFDLAMHRDTVRQNDTTEALVETIGYVLQDDDAGDNFTVDVLTDRSYQTPVFRLRAGQSSCPFELGTQPREGVHLSVDKIAAANVPYNDAAVFNFTLANASGSEEQWSYLLALGPESNVDGAIVKANGAPLTVPVLYEVLPGEPLNVVVTVERGPTAFNYEDLEIAWYSQCEDFRATSLGFSPDTLCSPFFPVNACFYSNKLLDVYFQEPCSPVDIGSPLQDWVKTPAGGNNMTIVLNSYLKTDPDLVLIRVQYRRSQGDGNWINIAEIPKASLGNLFTNVTWNTAGLADGLYEIRAITQCTGVDFEPGISHVIKGRIERTPPELFGTPEPADGVYDIGDEISIRFNEPIDCDQLIEAAGQDNNNIGLYNTRTDQLVGFDFACSGDKIVITPTVPQVSIENEILRVEVDSVKDLVGNAFVHEDWEFFVNRNPLRWQITDLVETKFEDEAKTFYRAIVNAGGSTQAYTLTGVPSWVNVFPKEGVLAPGQQQFVTFEFDSSLVIGAFNDTIIMDAPLGDEPLPIHFRNLCRPPTWESQFNPADFANSMSLTVELDIQGDLSLDEEDLVAAFVNGQVRGLAYVEHLQVGSLDTFVAFLTVYSDTFQGETVNFRIWDASECLVYGTVLETVPFVGEEVVGSPLAPLRLHTNGQVLRKIPLKPGWNWISFNLALPNPLINPALASLKYPQNDVIKNNNQGFATYANAPLSTWLPPDFTLNNLTAYQFRADVPDTITILGLPVNPATTNIPIEAGWNWISYLPQLPLPVDEALASYVPDQGDVIKNQTSFAQYVAGFGWLGNLHFMQAPEGYLLKSLNAGTLNYPDNFTGSPTVEDRSNPPSGGQGGDRSPWAVNPAEFEQTMILIGTFSENGTDATREGMTLGAFVNDEVRGVAPAIYIEPLDKWMFFLTIYANQSGEPLTFKLHDAESDAVSDLQEGFLFATDDQKGTVELPQPFTLPTSAAGESPPAPSRGLSRLLVQPNPFSNSTIVSYQAAGGDEVTLTVTDALGRLVERLDWQAAPGWNTLEWTAEGLPGGVYFLKVGAVTRKVVLER